MEYTKKQLLNALRHWTRRLPILEESRSKVVDELIEVFGKEVVCNSNLVYKPNLDDLEKMFGILNKHFFEGKLKKIEIAYWPEENIVDKINDHALESEVYDYKIDSAKCYGAFSAVCHDKKNKSGDIIDVEMRDDIIMLNSSSVKKAVFIFVVASLCHEMIHYYERCTVEYHDKVLMASQKKTKLPDSHEEHIFQEKMAEANSQGINVIVKPPKNSTYVEVNLKAAFVLSKVFGEDDSNDHTIISGNDQTLIMRSKGSDKFLVCYFD